MTAVFKLTSTTDQRPETAVIYTNYSLSLKKMSHPIYRVRIFCSSLHSLPKVHFCPKIQFHGNTENTKKVLSHFAQINFVLD